jgi:hypothetical protein
MPAGEVAQDRVRFPEEPYERVEAGGAFGRVRDPDYVAMNPNSLVPVMEEDVPGRGREAGRLPVEPLVGQSRRTGILGPETVRFMPAGEPQQPRAGDGGGRLRPLGIERDPAPPRPRA